MRTLSIGLMKCGRARWQEAEATRKDVNTVRALQGHSGRNPSDPSLQDNVLIRDNFFEYIYHIGCAINLHSITNSGLPPNHVLHLTSHSGKGNLKKSYTRRYTCHLDHHRKFPTKIIGCVIWILLSLEAAKITNESNQNPKPNYQVRRDPYVGKSQQKKSRNVLCLITTLLVKKNMMLSQTQQVRGDPYVDQNPQSVAC